MHFLLLCTYVILLGNFGADGSSGQVRDVLDLSKTQKIPMVLK